MCLRYCYLFLLTFTHTLMAQSQYESGGWQERYIHQSTDSLLLDSLTLVPGSLEVLSRGTLLDSSQYTYNYTTGYLIICSYTRQPYASLPVAAFQSSCCASA